jgi:hypothetical protein
MFEMLGVNPKTFCKVAQPRTIEAEDSQFQSFENLNGLSVLVTLLKEI